MQTRRRRILKQAEAGFSMVEMLMTAFILAVGILGLTMLQTMSLKASRGSQSLTTAVLVAEQVLDQADFEGRLSWLNLTNSNQAAPTLADLPNLRYLTIPAGGQFVQTFNVRGGAVIVGSPDPLVSTPFFTVTTTRMPSGAAAITGGISDVNVRVQFSDGVDANNAPIPRTVSLTRRIWHG